MEQHSAVLCKLLSSWTGLSNQDLVASFILAALSLRSNSKWSVGPIPIRNHPTASDRLVHGTQTLVKDVPSLLPILHVTPNLLKWCNASSPSELSLRSIFLHVRLRGLKPATNSAMLGWFDHRRPLVLLHHIPSPNEVLKQQAHGKRVCTLFLEPKQLASLHVSPLAYMSGNQSHARDALDFLIHDLSHIELFCTPSTHIEQVGFFNCMYQLDPTEQGKPFRFFRAFANMKLLWPQFQYVFSDMNCHATHLLSYLKAKWLMHDEQQREVQEKNAKNAKGTTKLGFNEGWPLMMDALGMQELALEGANKLCGGEKMTREHGEAIRDFFRARGIQVLKEQNDMKKDTNENATTVCKETKTPSNPVPPLAPPSPSLLLPPSPSPSLSLLPPPPPPPPPTMTVAEKVAQQVQQIRTKRIQETQAKSKATKQAHHTLLVQDTTFMKQQEKHYFAIVESFSLNTGFMASHAARNQNGSIYDKHRKSLKYGEIPYQTLAMALQKIKTVYKGLRFRNDVMYDLGSGTGKVCIAAALYHASFQKIIGIELLKELHDVSIQLLQSFQTYVAECNGVQTALNKRQNIQTVLGDLTEIPWYNDATVVFCNTLVFDEELLCTLAEMLIQVQPGCFLITSGALNTNNRLDKHFNLMECSMQLYSWGKSSLYIHQRK